MTPSSNGFENSIRPLLELIQRLTGLETTFVTEIDWEAQEQEIILALNTEELTVPEGTVVPWADTMCRLTFQSGKEHSSEVPQDFPGSVGADQFGLQSFLTLPLIDETGSTVGTFCGASKRRVELSSTIVANLELIARAAAFQVAAHREGRMLRGRAERAEVLALADPLTGLANRRHFEARLEEEAARAGRAGRPIAVLALDLDHFKAVNDTYGHHGGDKVLTTVGQVLNNIARVEDVPARLGGDEFVLLLAPGDRASAQEVGRRLAAELRKATSELGMPCTLSIGVGTTAETPLDALLEAADRELYEEKKCRVTLG